MLVNRLLTAGLIVVLAGCSGSPAPPSGAPAPPPAAVSSAPVSPAASASASADAPPPADARPPADAGPPADAARTPAPPPALDRFVAAVQRQLPQVVMDRREEEVAAIGELACSSQGGGKSRAAVLADIEDAGVTQAEARKLLTLAEETACRP